MRTREFALATFVAFAALGGSAQAGVDTNTSGGLTIQGTGLGRSWL